MTLEHNLDTDTSHDIASRVDALLQQMTLAEKIGQMTQAEKNSITPDDVTSYAIGSVLSGGGGNPDPNTPENWANMVRDFAQAALKSRLGIPLLYGSDAVHGHSNVKDAVIFPHNIGLGATRNPDLLEKIGEITARECLATGVNWDFAPAVSVPHDIRWGRTYEGYSENTDLVTQLSTAFLKGLQSPQFDDRQVLGSVKHFVGDGGTTWGSTKPALWLEAGNWQAADERYRIDRGDTQLSEDLLRSLHLKPYISAIEAGALNIMVSFSSWNGDKVHGHRYLLTDVLKGELGFQGFLVSDWQAIDEIDPDFYTCVVSGINAGLDMIMVPFDYRRFIQTTTDAVNKGDIALSRIDDAVRRILYVKMIFGLFEEPLSDPSWVDSVGSEQHRQVATDAVQQSLVLLKNDHQALPLKTDQAVLVAGQAADDIGLACGGWTIDWQGSAGNITTGNTLVGGLETIMPDSVIYSPQANFSDNASQGIVVIAEKPYAEGVGDATSLELTPEQKDLIRKTRAHCQHLTLVIYSGRPLIISDVVGLCDAVVAAWWPGTEAYAIADILCGKQDFTGKLSFTWPATMQQIPLEKLEANEESPLWEFGEGLSYS